MINEALRTLIANSGYSSVDHFLTYNSGIDASHNDMWNTMLGNYGFVGAMQDRMYDWLGTISQSEGTLNDRMTALDGMTWYVNFFDVGSGVANVAPMFGNVSPTFTRNSTAYTVGSDGLLVSVAVDTPRSMWKPDSGKRNLVYWSQDWTRDPWQSWNDGNVTIGLNAVTAPDGTNTGTSLTENANTNEYFYMYQYFGGDATLVDGTYTFSCYAKKAHASRPYFWLGIYGIKDTDYEFDVYLNLDTGEISTFDYGIAGYPYSHGFRSMKVEDAGDGWWRVQMTFDAHNADPDYVYSVLGFTTQLPTRTGYSGAMDGVDAIAGYVWQAQLEKGSEASDVICSTGYLGHGAPTEYLGYLNERSATNLVTRSQAFASIWTHTDGTIGTYVTNAYGIAPDGTLTSSLIGVAAGTNPNGHGIRHSSLAVTSGEYYALSFWAKASSVNRVGVWSFVSVDLTGSCIFNLETGVVDLDQSVASSARIVAYPNGWFFCSLYFQATATTTINFHIQPQPDADITQGYTADGTETIELWGVQLEHGKEATSYIPTAGSSASRVIDALSYDDAVLSDTEGSVLMEAMCHEFTRGWVLGWGSAGNLMNKEGTTNNVGLSTYDGTVSASTASLDWTTGSPLRLGITWATGGNKYLYAPGVAAESSAYDGSWNGTTLRIGNLTGTDTYANNAPVKWVAGYSDALDSTRMTSWANG